MTQTQVETLAKARLWHATPEKVAAYKTKRDELYRAYIAAGVAEDEAPAGLSIMERNRLAGATQDAWDAYRQHVDRGY